MEILVDIVKVEMKEREGSSLGGVVIDCKITAGEEVYTQQSPLVSPNERVPGRAREGGIRRWPKLKFQFRQPNLSATLLLTLFTNSSSSSSSASASTKLGGCMEHLTFQQVGHRLQDFHRHTAEQNHVGLLGSQIEGTDVTRFAGKIWFKVNHVLHSSSLTMPPGSTQERSESANEQLRHTGEAPFVLLSREVEQSCRDIFPSITPTVSIVFHSVNSTTLTRSAEQLRPVAYLASDGNTKNSTTLQTSSTKNHSAIPMLKPVTLACDNHVSLELHMIADTTMDSVIFSASHQLSSLTPFKHYNWHDDLRCLSGTVGHSMPFLGPSDPTVIVSVTYTPSLSQYAQYDGLELFIPSLKLSPSLQGKNVLLSVQLLSANSKMKAQGGKTYDPPFLRNNKKGKLQESESYSISAIRFQTSSIQQTSTKSVYLFYSKDPHFTPERGNSDVSVSILVYAVDPASPFPWWQTPLVASCRLDILSEAQRVLQLPANHEGVYWELTGSEISQPEGLVLTPEVCGVLRWKSVRTQFLTPLIENQLSSLPSLHDVLRSESESHLHDQPQISQSSNRSSTTVAKSQLHNQPPTPSSSNNHHSSLVSQPQDQPLTPPIIDPNQSSIGLAVPEVGILSSLLAEHEGSHDFMSEQDLARLAEYKEAVVLMGKDILTLRQQNVEIQSHNEELSNEIARMQSIAVAVKSADQKVLETLPKAKLIQRITELHRSLSTESGSRKFYQGRVQSLQNTLIRKNEFEVQCIQLQEAHTAQQKLVRQLQAKVSKYRRCGSLCKQQESLISHLELLLAQQAQGHGKGDAVSLLTRENAQLRAAVQEYQTGEPEHKYLALLGKEDLIQSLKVQLSQLTSKCQELEEQLVQCSRGKSEQLEIFELEQRLSVSEARASTLMKELQENARKWATEKAHYEVRLAEYRSTVAEHGQHIPSEGRSPSHVGTSEAPLPAPDRPTVARITF